MGIVILVLVGAALLYGGISTGLLWTILGWIFSLIGTCIWEILKAIGLGIGSLLGAVFSGIFSGIATGMEALFRVIAMPLLIAGIVGFTCLMIWRAFFR